MFESLSDRLTGALKDLRGNSQIWMSHSDFCSRLADGCQVLGTNE